MFLVCMVRVYICFDVVIEFEKFIEMDELYWLLGLIVYFLVM